MQHCDFYFRLRQEARKNGPLQWTVWVGEQSRDQVVDRLRRSSISEQNEDEGFILLVKNSPEFQISPTAEELDLIVVTADELGLPTALWEPLIPFDAFKAKVLEAGYKLCPHDAVALLVLSIRGHETVEFTYVATIMACVRSSR